MRFETQTPPAVGVDMQIFKIISDAAGLINDALDI